MSAALVHWYSNSICSCCFPHLENGKKLSIIINYNYNKKFFIFHSPAPSPRYDQLRYAEVHCTAVVKFCQANVKLLLTKCTTVQSCTVYYSCSTYRYGYPLYGVLTVIMIVIVTCGIPMHLLHFHKHEKRGSRAQCSGNQHA